MKIYYFGTCAGTEPMMGRHHQSFAIETADKSVYWFDAGENCSYTAHLMGVDLLSIRSVFISHTHMDHVGGLGNLFWNIRKLTSVLKKQPSRENIDLYIPNLDTWNGVMQILRNTESGFKTNFRITAHEVTEDGVIFKDENITVEAVRNHHIPDGRSFSYKIIADGKIIVYSGDIRGMEDIVPFIKDGCDVLMIESGHHVPTNICEFIKTNGFSVGKLRFIHNGYIILENESKAVLDIAECYDGDFSICHDGTVEEIN